MPGVRFGELEIPPPHIACTRVRGDDDPRRRPLRALETEAARLRGAAEEALALAEHDGEGQDAQLVGEVVREEGLHEVARALRHQVGPLPFLQLVQRRDRIGAERAAVLPGERTGPVSSCGPPGACITPSRLTNAQTMTFLTIVSPCTGDDERRAEGSTGATNFLSPFRRGVLPRSRRRRSSASSSWRRRCASPRRLRRQAPP